ncbi:DUF4097 family beta strand repeat-containing protein [Streptomyces sp. NPDC090025]|uniref:DUF4097 family beta strand repeat-containing protein n=1 Tax=Streptomyces sp. NPDC090025 TaxID=3365922 RepID=UPI0038343D33
MPSFPTPEPITVVLEFDFGNVRLNATTRSDTVVEVLPSTGSEGNDIKAVKETKVSYANGVLTVKGPRRRSVFGRTGSIDVSVDLPAGSHLQGNAPMGDFIAQGRLGECRVKTSVGTIQLADTGTVDLRASHGDIRVARIAGDADLNGSGRIDIGEITGTAAVKNGIGETVIGAAAGGLKVNTSMGRVTVGVAEAGVDVRSSHGSITIGELVRGSATLQTSLGGIEIGIREGTAAWLDVHSKVGAVRNSLGPAEGPAEGDETVEIHARTSAGDIVIRRA